MRFSLAYNHTGPEVAETTISAILAWLHPVDTFHRINIRAQASPLFFRHSPFRSNRAAT